MLYSKLTNRYQRVILHCQCKFTVTSNSWLLPPASEGWRTPTHRIPLARTRTAYPLPAPPHPPPLSHDQDRVPPVLPSSCFPPAGYPTQCPCPILPSQDQDRPLACPHPSPPKDKIRRGRYASCVFMQEDFLVYFIFHLAFPSVCNLGINILLLTLIYFSPRYLHSYENVLQLGVILIFYDFIRRPAPQYENYTW